ncbi:MAG: hypothetical protein QM522_11030 [Chitinophagaceae bacterium]|nr:hypothetical protein [Chitinophagaceae bacterium]
MAALTLASIPSSINTIERLLAWAAMCLQSSANGAEVNVVAGSESQPVCQVQVAVTADNIDRFVISAYVPIDRNELNSGTAKTWMAAKDVSAAAPHSNLLSN